MSPVVEAAVFYPTRQQCGFIIRSVIQSWKMRQFHNIPKSRNRKSPSLRITYQEKRSSKDQKTIKKNDWGQTIPNIEVLHHIFLITKGKQTHITHAWKKPNVSLQLKVLRVFLEKREVTCNESPRSDCPGSYLWNRTPWKLSGSTITREILKFTKFGNWTNR